MASRDFKWFVDVNIDSKCKLKIEVLQLRKQGDYGLYEAYKNARYVKLVHEDEEPIERFYYQSYNAISCAQIIANKIAEQARKASDKFSNELAEAEYDLNWLQLFE